MEDLAFALEGMAGALAEQEVSPAAAGLAQVRMRCLPGFLTAHRVCWGICQSRRSWSRLLLLAVSGCRSGNCICNIGTCICH